ncbi:MAG: GIY-YIG nuclease family protein [Pygmaiobacter sp.]|nr:GIY-YIG nuclease family protein [Pygmaiobacter sp.]
MDAALKRKLRQQYKAQLLRGGVDRICCAPAGKSWLRATTELQGVKNRLSFACNIGSCPEPDMRPAWDQYGPASFTLEVLEELEQKETQTEREFADDIAVLRELWAEKLAGGEPV